MEFRTLTMKVQRIRQYIQEGGHLPAEARARLTSTLTRLLAALEQHVREIRRKPH